MGHKAAMWLWIFWLTNIDHFWAMKLNEHFRQSHHLLCAEFRSKLWNEVLKSSIAVCSSWQNWDWNVKKKITDLKKETCYVIFQNLRQKSWQQWHSWWILKESQIDSKIPSDIFSWSSLVCLQNSEFHISHTNVCFAEKVTKCSRALPLCLVTLC